MSDKKITHKPRILSGIQPTGQLMIGNHLGALRQWVYLQESHDCFYTLVDLHAITVRQNPEVFNERCYSFVAQYIACGIDPKQSTLFIQSHVHEHSELMWLLNCFTYMGELNRMTQFKDKSNKHAENINAGLLSYPVLMAADILLYQANLVPVGEDQKQHLELCRDLVNRFNEAYSSKLFSMPEPFIPPKQDGGRIMALQEPSNKMSKSDDNEQNVIGLLDSPKQIEKKIKRAVTDSEDHIAYDWERKPGISNLLTLYSATTHTSIEDAVKHFDGKMYGHLKIELAQALIDFLDPIQQEYHRLMHDKGELQSILKDGADKASAVAGNTLDAVKKAIGFVPRY